MRLRPYREKDTAYIRSWVQDEETHIKWCANRLKPGFSAEEFRERMQADEEEWNDCAFTATAADGRPVGYFRLSIQEKDNTGFLKYIIVDSRERGKGLGSKMLLLAARYAFTVAGLDEISLIVFDENEAAAACYRKAGFRLQDIPLPPLEAAGKSWSRTRMGLTAKDAGFEAV